jgi:hypothetical protein
MGSPIASLVLPIVLERVERLTSVLALYIEQQSDASVLSCVRAKVRTREAVPICVGCCR